MKRRSLINSPLTLISVLLVSAILTSNASAQSTFYLIRHAEKIEDGSRDPALTAQGEARAQTIAKRLQRESISRVFSTPYRRTMATAEPIASVHGLSIVEYDAGDLPAFAERLKLMTGNIVVIGHSNTTPTLVNLLTGANLADLDESVYDRIYVVNMDSAGNGRFEVVHTLPRTSQ